MKEELITIHPHVWRLEMIAGPVLVVDDDGRNRLPQLLVGDGMGAIDHSMTPASH